MKNLKLLNKKNLFIFCSAAVVVLTLIFVISSNSSKTKVVAINNTDFSINNISSNKVACVGKIELSEGSEYLINVSSESGSDIFVALNESDDITDAQGVEWKQYNGNKGKEIEAKFLDDHIGIFYVYVGTKGSDLKNTLVSIISSNLNINASNITEFEDIKFSIDNIDSKEVSCIGRIELKTDSNFLIDVSAKSGENIFVALNKSDDIEKAQGTEWKQYYEVAQSDIQKNFTGVEAGIFYVYVGTKGDGLAEVEGKLSSIR